MILESILERSGLRKNEQYFMEHELLTDDGNKLKSDSENKKMRPDVVIKYPDNRHVIIDSKVSLNAFTRFVASDDVAEQKQEIKDHVSAIKAHIVALSNKGYDDYDKSLDFVLMFIPSESAYMAALQEDPELWGFAYDKRIILISPTNLITSLKLIVDLWKREYQTKNAIEIADFISNHGISSIRLVTSSYHMPRALLEVQRFIPMNSRVNVVPHPVFSEYQNYSVLFKEYNKYLIRIYKVSGACLQAFVFFNGLK